MHKAAEVNITLNPQIKLMTNLPLPDVMKICIFNHIVSFLVVSTVLETLFHKSWCGIALWV
jgi:hypothetical protein